MSGRKRRYRLDDLSGLADRSYDSNLMPGSEPASLQTTLPSATQRWLWDRLLAVLGKDDVVRALDRLKRRRILRLVE